MARPRKLTADQIAAAQVMWLAGVARKLIADRFSVSERTVYYEMKKLQKPVSAENTCGALISSAPNRTATSGR